MKSFKQRVIEVNLEIFSKEEELDEESLELYHAFLDAKRDLQIEEGWVYENTTVQKG